jgi:hypothetical protein
MNKALAITFYLTVLVITAFGQLQLSYEDNAYLNSDFQPFILTQNVDEGLAGPNQVWDFSQLVKTGEIKSYMSEARQSPANIWYPKANIVLRENTADFFFKVSSSGIEEYGVKDGNFAITYDKPIVKFPFPFVYGSSISGTYSGQVVDKPEEKIAGAYSTQADGYGTLILPGNVVIKDVLRIRFVRSNDKANGETVIFRWYARNSDPIVRYPLLSITKFESSEKSYVYRVAYYANCDQLINSTKIVTIDPVREFTSPKSENYNLTIYPNPFIENAKIEYNLPKDAIVKVLATDNLGRNLETLSDSRQNAGKHTLTYSGKGTFVSYITFFVDGEMVCSKKIIHLNK